MKLSERELQQLTGIASNARPALIDDACELLTLKIVLWLKAKRKEIDTKRTTLPVDPLEVPAMKVESQLLGKLIVELAEAP